MILSRVTAEEVKLARTILSVQPRLFPQFVWFFSSLGEESRAVSSRFPKRISTLRVNKSKPQVSERCSPLKYLKHFRNEKAFNEPAIKKRFKPSEQISNGKETINSLKNNVIGGGISGVNLPCQHLAFLEEKKRYHHPKIIHVEVKYL